MIAIPANFLAEGCGPGMAHVYQPRTPKSRRERLALAADCRSGWALLVGIAVAVRRIGSIRGPQTNSQSHDDADDQREYDRLHTHGVTPIAGEKMPPTA